MKAALVNAGLMIWVLIAIGVIAYQQLAAHFSATVFLNFMP